MDILVIGGTRFFGIPMVEELLNAGHHVTIATRGLSADSFGSSVQRIILDRTDAQSVRDALSGRHFDIIIDYDVKNRVEQWQEICTQVQQLFPDYHVDITLDADAAG